MPMKLTHAFPSSQADHISDVAYHASLALLGCLVFLVVILMKSKAANVLDSNLPLLVYSIFVTTFELSRLIAAIFYRHSFARIKELGIDDKELFYEPFVSFVIPCKNEERSIGKTIQKCFAANYNQEKLEVIVVNDGSTDGTIQVLRRLRKQFRGRLIVIDWNENKGKRQAMAEGIRRAKGEIVVQLDSDSYVVPQTFRSLVELFRNPEVGAVSAHTEPENAEENVLTRMQVAYYFMSFRILKAAESTFLTVFCCSGCCSAYRRSVVAPILDQWTRETFLGLPVTWGDDRALTNWVLRQNYRTLYTEEVKAYTLVPTTIRQFLKQQTRWKKGWFVNSMFALGFIIKQNPFVAFTYFIPLILVTLLTPFMAARALVYNPLVHNVMPTYYFVGVLLIAFLIIVYYRYIARTNKYWPYIFLWACFNTAFLSFILFYALLTIQNRSWGTR